MEIPTNTPTSNAPAPSPAPAASAPAAASPAPPANDPPPAAAAPAAPAAKAEPPAGLDANFWDADKGSVKWEDLNKEFAALKTAKAEWDNARSVVPDAPDKYEVKPPEGFQLPEGMQLDPNDARLGQVRDLAHKAGFSQKQFEALIAMDAQIKAAEVAEFNKRVKLEGEKLGPDGGKARVEAVTRSLTGVVGEGLARHLVPMMVSAAQVQAMETLLSKLANQGTATGGYAPAGAAGKTTISEDEWAKMTPVERFNFSRQNAAQGRA